MADIKFSQFTPQSSYTSVQEIVGYNGSSNVRISPNNFIASWNARQSTLSFQDNIVGTTSLLEVGAASHTKTELNLTTSAAASYQINGLNAVTYNGTGWGIADNNIEVDTTASKVISYIPYLEIGDGIASTVQILAQPAAGGSFELSAGNQQIINSDPGSELIIGPNDDMSFDDTGSPLIYMFSPLKPSTIIDASSSEGLAGYTLTSKGPNSGIEWEQKNPACQVKISGGAGLANTNNGADFLVPYNTVTVNDDATIFNPVTTGGLGSQGAIQVLKAGRYAFQARYSSFDLVQSSLPTVDGSKFFKITASTDTVAAGVGTKQCVLQDLIVATSTNGEAVVTGSGYMDLNANDYFKIIGLHTGATGGSGTQGFPVNNNALFNEPQLWLVKVQ